jgi:hypothetical protein
VAARHIATAVLTGAALRRAGSLATDAVALASRMHGSRDTDGPYIAITHAACVAVLARVGGRTGAVGKGLVEFLLE